MEFKINGKDVKLKFGVKFIRMMDERHNIDYEGFQFGMGIGNAVMGMEQFSVPVLADIIHSATKGEYALDDIDDAIDERAEEDGNLKKLFKQINDELGKSETVVATLKNFEKNAKTDDKTNQSKPTKK